MIILSLTLLVPLAVGAGNGGAEEPPKTTPLKTESFDQDPGWEGHNNRIVPERVPTVTQDFGYSKTNFAGKAAGELGGGITRASEPAYYADKIGPVTLDDKLSALGTFALTKTTAGGGMFFGFFRAEQPGAVGAPPARWASTWTASAAALAWPCGSSRARTRAAARSSRRSSPASFDPPRSATTARATNGRSTMTPRAPAVAVNSRSPSTATHRSRASSRTPTSPRATRRRPAAGSPT